MDSYREYSRGSPDPRPRSSGRDRDDYRSDSYRDRRRSPDRRRERDRERRRSRSPPNIDRYQPDRAPRDEYRARDFDDSRRRRSPERGYNAIDRYVPGQEPPPPFVNIMPDPLKLDIQVGFNWYAEWWRQEQRVKEDKERRQNGRPPRIKGEREAREEKEQERAKIQADYDVYKETLQKTQASTFVRMHKDEDWFREKYVPEVRDPFRAKLAAHRKELYRNYENDLTDGNFDDFTLEGIYKAESNGLGGVVEKEEGETVAAAEVLQTGDLVPSLGGDLRDPLANQPTLLLKTIAPTVTRVKLEEFATELLGSGPGGFKHLSLSDPNPLKKCHRMGWIVLQPVTEESDADVMELNNDVEDGEAEKPAKQSVAERALQKIDGKIIEDADRGNFTLHCGIHRPPDAPRKKALWDLFSAPERIRRDLELATRLVRKLDNELGIECFGMAKIEERVNALYDAGRLQPVKAPKASGDMDIMDDFEEGEEEGAIDEDETDDAELLIDKKKLDLLVEYLRRVYNFCFFCVFESDSIHELQRKCPGGHLRRPRASLTTLAKEVAVASARGEVFPLKSGRKDAKGDDEDLEMLGGDSPVEERNKFAPKINGKNALQLQRAFNWVKTYEEKILQLLEPEHVNLKKLGGVPLEEGIEEEMKKFCQQEDVNKFRCTVPLCTKLFKGPEFWRKHVKTRHADFYSRICNDIELVNTYVLDPSHIAPSRSDANSNGHFPIGAGGMPTGTPRGFSLQQHMSGMAGVPMIPAQYGPPGSFSNPVHHVVPGIGPVRTRGGGASYRSAGPYSRPGAYVPGARVRGSDLDARNGQAPREAIAGRTVRSYEDLDAAAPNTKEPEMDY